MPGPDLSFETSARAAVGSSFVAGLDEAGRGALAGPVVAAAVILPLDDPAALRHLAGVNDSKLLPPDRREALFSTIQAAALAWGVGVVEAEDIDRLGIIAGTKAAMRAALAGLDPAPGYLLVDGRLRLQGVNLPQQAIIRGDSRSLTIAAASIIAKVTRDRLMEAYDPQYPAYGFAHHKGYGTAAHRAVLAVRGPSAIHRRSFAPLRQTLFDQVD